MQGRLIIGIIALAALAVPVAATELPRRPACPKAESQRQLPAQQVRRNQWCRVPKVVPPVVDPTPIFLL